MKSKIAAAVFVLFVIAAVVLNASTFVVEEGKQVIVTQFGEWPTLTPPTNASPGSE